MTQWGQEWGGLGQYGELVDDTLREMGALRIMERIWAHDHTVWKSDPAEITNRLGWLRAEQVVREQVDGMRSLADDLRTAGYADVLLLGMGGSSLAPEMYRKTFGVGKDVEGRSYLDLAVLDSTDPGAVQAHAKGLDPARTLFVVATKSGGTVETLSFFKFFYNWVADALGRDQAGEHFVAITDPESRMADLAESYQFRATFINDPDIGGRYSGLSFFGLVPAALIGADLSRLLDGATTVVKGCGPDVPTEVNPAARLGAVMGRLAMAGRDKLTLIVSPALASFGDWVEQLVAESTGKEGKGILPVVGEPLGPPSIYGDDRLFVWLELGGDGQAFNREVKAKLAALQVAGHPVVHLSMRDRYDLGGQMFLWAMAVAVAGHLLGINPFDQPNVESAKVAAREILAQYVAQGALPGAEPTQSGDGIEVYGDVAGGTPAEALRAFLGQAGAGSYAALQAYVQPTRETDRALLALRTRIRDEWRLATPVGYGPRFLHSTGQLHKGDAGRGLFVQFTADDAEDLAIPDEAGERGSSVSFGVLKAAQVLGDWRALLNGGRRVVRFHLGADPARSLKNLTQGLSRTEGSGG